MSTRKNQLDDSEILLAGLGVVMVAAAAFVVAPGYVAGGCVALIASVIAVALVTRETADRRAWKVRGLTVAGFGLVLLLAYLLLNDDLGWAPQLARFEQRWEYPIDWATAARFPAAWLPQAVAVAAIGSGLATAWASRER